MGYECLLAGLPELHTGQHAPISIEALDEQLNETVSESDMELIELLRRTPQDEKVFEDGLKVKNDFLRNWYTFNLDLNNILVAAICRKHKMPLKGQIVGNNEVAETLREDRGQKDFGLTGVVDDYESIMRLLNIDNLQEREKQLDAIRFAWLEENTLFIDFSIENVLAYYLESQMLNRWTKLNPEDGERIFRAMVADMKKDVKFE